MTYRDVIPFEKLNEIAGDIIDMKVAAVTFSGGGSRYCIKDSLISLKNYIKAGLKLQRLLME
jgi:hypothetical protein